MTGPAGLHGVGKTSENNLIESAFLLAHFILEDEKSAELSAAAALARLNVATVAQDRRYYYVPGASPKAYGVRTKVTLNELHLLQRLIYDETAPYELAQEELAQIAQEKLLKHFLKHLVRITLKRNSFYVSLAVSRLLHRYSTPEAVELYSLVVQNPSRAKDNHYWRSRKAQLMQEMKARFGELISLTRGAYGEERFACRDDSPRYASFVNECLSTLMPWNTSCPLPSGTEPVSGAIPALDFKGTDPDEEHRVEITRIHAMLHADCFTRLIAGLNLDAPGTRLEVPHFFRPQNFDPQNFDSMETMKSTGLRVTDMDRPNLNRIRDGLNEQARLLRRAKPRRLRLVVDRQERGILDLNGTHQTQFPLNEGEEFLELRTLPEEGDVRLALYPIDYTRWEQAHEDDHFVLETTNGHKINFSFALLRDEYGEATGATVTASGQKTGWQSRLRGLLPTLMPSAPAFSYALTAAFLLIGLTGAFLLWQLLQANSSSTNVAVNKPPAVTPSNHSTGSKADVFPSPVIKETPAANTVGKGPQPLPKGGASTHQAIGGQLGTRREPDLDASSAVISLSEVKQIFIPQDAGGIGAAALREEMRQQMLASGRWTASSQEDAEAALNITIRPGGQTASVQLVNASGLVIWPAKGNWRSYSGNEEQIAKQVIADWLKAAR